MNNENIKSPTIIWKQFEAGQKYLQNKGLTETWKQCENFYEGNQWPAPTKRTKALPRPVVNITSMIADNKKSGILSENIKLVFKPSEMFGDLYERAEQGADLFTKFAESISRELKQNDLDDKAQDYATQLGTYVYHYFWDTTISGGMQTPYVGAMRGEIIEPKNIVFANPLEEDEQKQKYIIIASCEPLESVRALAKRNKVQNWEEIVADTEMEESEESELATCTVLTKYSRQNGKVVWEKSTKTVYLQKPTLWEPSKEKVKFEDEEEINEPDTANRNDYFKKQLYPIVVGSHKRRKRCIYGIGEVEQSIPNNKAVNFNLGMMLLSVQQTAWPQIIAKVNALANQQITNEPGGIITDYSKGQNWGAKYMDTPGFNAQALTLTNTIIDLTRSATGSTEVVTGEVLGANMAASAIIALQNQAKKPIEMYQKKFYRTHIKIGKIYEQFFKYFYNDGRLFGYEDDGNQYVASMNGEQYMNYDFNLSVEAGTGGVWSESLSVSLLDNLKADGTIDQDEYIELYPDSIMPFKQKLKRMRERKQQEMMQQLALQNQLVNQNMIAKTNIPNQLNNGL